MSAPLILLYFHLLAALGTYRVVRRSPSYAPMLLICAAPFDVNIAFGPTIITLAKTVLIVSLLTLIAYHRHRLRITTLRERALLGIAGALVLATAATFLTAAHPGATLRETAKAVEYALIIWVVFATAEDTMLLPALAGTSTVVAVLALSQAFGGAPSVLVIAGVKLQRVAGPLEGPNQLAAYLGLCIPWLIAIEARRPRPTPWHDMLPSILALLGAVQLLTLSRGGIGSTLIAAGIATRMRPSRGLTATLLGGGVAACALTVGFALVAPEPSTHRVPTHQTFAQRLAPSNLVRCGILLITARGKTLDTSGASGGVGHRAQLWRAAIALWRRSPWLGIGAGNYELELPLVGLRGVRTHANSLPLQALAEGGILLFAVTITSMLVPIALLAPGRRPRHQAIIGAYAAGIGLAMHQIVDTLVFYPKVGVLWWIIAAYGIAMNSTQVIRPKDPMQQFLPRSLKRDI